MAARVVVVGSLNMDLVVRAPRLPRPGETLLARSLARHPGGKGANQALAAARLFAPQRGAVALVGRVGDDEHGRALVELLAREGVDTTHALPAGGGQPTGVAVVTVDERGENHILVVSGANAALTAGAVERGAALFERARVVVAQLEIPLEAVAASARLARDGGALFVLNAAPARELDPALLAAVDLLVVNESEAGCLDGAGAPGPRERARNLLQRGPRAVVLTLGARGALWCDAQGSREQPAPRVEAVDTTGAGDAFVGALAHALATGYAPLEALRRACTAGALAVTREGATPCLPTAAALEIQLSGRPGPGPSAS